MTDRIEDPQLRFYLDRKEQIDEWAKLAGREHAAANTFLESLTETIEERRDLVDDRAIIETGSLGGMRYTALTREPWTVADEHAIALVAVEWWPKSVSFTRPGYCACVGVRVRRGDPYAEHHDAVTRKLADTDALRSFASRGGPSSNWLGWTYEPLREPDWDDFTPYREHLVDALLGHWAALAPHLDVALGSPT